MCVDREGISITTDGIFSVSRAQKSVLMERLKGIGPVDCSSLIKQTLHSILFSWYWIMHFSKKGDMKKYLIFM